ncbi:MAG: hypothetical protein HQL13_03355 [Candidatus Omnitrophica bacterium]|nr:hypothetical protein [Candidatus Omnitrophota bacterium]
MNKVFVGSLMMLMACFYSATTAQGAEVLLLSGAKVVGTILEQTEFRVMLDVKGIPKTYFLGEIESIDGKAPDALLAKVPEMSHQPAQNIPNQKPATDAAQAVLKAANPHFDEEKDALEEFMKRRNAPSAVQNSKTEKSAQCHSKHHCSKPVPQQPMCQPQVSKDPMEGLHEMAAKNAGTGQNVFQTADGGIIVVSSRNKLIKYDKNLNFIKEVKID